ncbi:MAG: NAD(P)-dependent oxidoreductase [Chitinispirillia bacterium]|nr:NAD(P)-dependent oxidoreductase [Chitinispirillia bacterium]
MKIFLTGGTGFIGHFAAREFLNRGHTLKILARYPNKIPSLAAHQNVEIVRGGLQNLSVMKNVLDGCGACVHIALGWGETPVSMLENDTAATVLLLEMAAKSGCEKFIYTSSTAAFGKMRPENNEGMACLPQDLYGATKAASEAFVLGFSKGYGNNFSNLKMKRNVIRPGYTFGHLAFPDGVTQPDRRFFDIAKAAKEGRPIKLIKNDGTQFIHASQLAKLYNAVLDSDVNEEIFFGLASKWISWKTIAERAIDMCPGTNAVIEEEDRGWGGRPCLFSVEKIEKTFDLKFDGSGFIDDHLRWNMSL